MEEAVPFACDMSALTTAQRAEHADVTRALFGAVTQIRSGEDRYGFVLNGDDAILALAGRFIALERRCCPFFTLTLTVAPGAPTELVIGGPPGVQPFIRAELGAHLRPATRFPDEPTEAAR